MSDTPDAISISEWRDGWRPLVGAMGAIGCGGPLFTYTAGLFVKRLETSLGWDRGDIGFGATCMMAVMAMTIPLIGVLTDRYGARRIGTIGLAGYGLLVLLLSVIPGDIRVYYAVLMAIALFSGATNSVVFSPVVVRHFMRWRGLAVALAMSGTALLMIPLSPILTALLDSHGWRFGYGLIGILPLLVGVPCALFLLDGGTARRGVMRPQGNTGDSFGDAVRSRAFWQIMLATIATTIPLGGFLHQLPALFSDKGQSGETVAMLASLFVAMIVVGRSVTGLLFDRFHAPFIAMTVMLAAAAGALLLLQVQLTLVACIVAVALIGSAMGGESDIQAYFTARQFGLRAFSTIFGAHVSISALCMGLGAWLFGAIHDARGSYDLAGILSASLFVLAGVLLGLLPNPRRTDVTMGEKTAAQPA
ncbi:MFS transporter [Sphingobium sp. EM0848]|uniref:MFS transporter n=1 Tax=Sphingobium sp. EM0848 TaxID=2743473 RepID=UPI001C3F8EF4|nr:MFS transporter [Sphingobium sp. EM0848]